MRTGTCSCDCVVDSAQTENPGTNESQETTGI